MAVRMQIEISMGLDMGIGLCVIEILASLWLY